METSRLRGVTHVVEVSVGHGEVEFEVGPSVFGGRSATPFATRVNKHVRAEHDVVGVVDYLHGRVGLASGIGKVHCILDLLNERFEGLVGVVGSFEADVVGM